MHLSSPKTKQTSMSPFLSKVASKAGKHEKNGAEKVHQLMLRASNDALGRSDPSRRSLPLLRGKCPHSVNQPDLPLDTRVGARSYPNQGRGVDYFVLDSGCQPSHAVFAGTDIRTMALPTSPFPASGVDDHGHGSHVAGTVAGSMKGVAPRARITCIKVLNSENRGKFSFLVSAFENAVAFKAANPDRMVIVQASIGGKRILDFITERMNEAGVIGVVSAGNDHSNACEASPARSLHVITVGNSDIDESVWHNSNIGPCVDLFARTSFPFTSLFAAALCLLRLLLVV